jgi:hypothetical protein
VAPSGPLTFHLAGRRASLGLAACLGHGAKMPRLRFYNQRSRHEHSLSTPPSETACRALRVNPRRPASRSITGRSGVATCPSELDAGPPCGHPASNGCVLDGTRAGFGPIDGRGGARALGGRAPALFRLTGMPCRSRSSETSLRAAGPGTASGPASSCLIPARRGHVNAGGILEIEVPSIVRARCGRSCESLSRRPGSAGRPAQVPYVFTAVRDTG